MAWSIRAGAADFLKKIKLTLICIDIELTTYIYFIFRRIIDRKFQEIPSTVPSVLSVEHRASS